jgi:hypothetical protein
MVNFPPLPIAEKKTALPRPENTPSSSKAGSIGQEAAFRYGVWKSAEMYREKLEQLRGLEAAL